MTPEAIAAGLTEAQRALLDDLCGCPGLFAGQYVHDGAGIEHLPGNLWTQTYSGGAGFMGLGKACPTEEGLAVHRILTRSPSHPGVSHE